MKASSEEEADCVPLPDALRRAPLIAPRLGLALALAAAGCALLPERRPPQPRRFPSGLERPLPEVIESRLLTESGGLLDWCAAADLIAFDRASDRRTSEIYAIRPDGSGERCLTCGHPDLEEGWQRGVRGDTGRGFRSSPAWHPSCEFLVIQVGAPHSRPTPWERPPFGINNDLWLVAADGSWAERIVTVVPQGGAMSPQFSDRGDRLLWTARQPTGRKVRQSLLDRTPGQENPWHGWHLEVADFERPRGGPTRLTPRAELFRGEPGFLRATALTEDLVWFSQTPNRRGYLDEIFRARLDGSERENLSASPESWEEQGEPSPWGTLLTYRSSRPLGWSSPPHPIGTLRLELWALTGSGQRVQLTRYNTHPTRDVRALASDYAWGPSGREIAVYSATYATNAAPRHAIEILRLNAAF